MRCLVRGHGVCFGGGGDVVWCELGEVYFLRGSQWGGGELGGWHWCAGDDGSGLVWFGFGLKCTTRAKRVAGGGG